MLKEIAETLGLTPYITDYSAPPRYIDPAFYDKYRNDDDPPIYRDILNDFATANEAQR